MSRSARVLGCALLATGILHCAAPPHPRTEVRAIDSPAAAGSAQPNLVAGGDGELYLSWIEPAGEAEHALCYSTWNGDGWSAPLTVARGRDWFVNWADFPSLAVLPNGTLAAHWLVRSTAQKFAYDVVLSVSADGERIWSEPVRPHRDGTPTEHGFVSLVPGARDRFHVVWLDGREMSGSGPGAMTLRHAVLNSDGTVGPEHGIDDRVCDCCQTAAVVTGDGTLLLAYRDRSPDEIRDIAITRFERDGWTQPETLHDDGWEIAGCPVNGPAVAGDGNRVAIAWYTESAPRRGHVRMAFSADGGQTFGPPVEIDDGDPVGRVDLILLEDGGSLVSWIEASAGGAEIRARRVSAAGAIEPSIVVAPTDSTRSSGFPHLARHAGRAFVAWTGSGDPSSIHTAVFDAAVHEGGRR